MGFQNVQTYIQNGNVIFKSTEENVRKLELKVSDTINKHFGFEVTVLIKTRADLQLIFDAYPFSEEKKQNSYFVMLNKIPNGELVKEVMKLNYEGEVFQIINDGLNFYRSKGIWAGKIQYEIPLKKN